MPFQDMLSQLQLQDLLVLTVLAVCCLLIVAATKSLISCMWLAIKKTTGLQLFRGVMDLLREAWCLRLQLCL